MRIDNSHQVLQTARTEQNVKGSHATRTGASGYTGGVAFEKNRNDVFVEQTERAWKEKALAEEETEPAKDAVSRLEVLANLTTKRDLEQFKEYSEDMEEEELEVIVTVVEKIKAQLATFCEDYDSGMLDDFSAEELEKVSHLTGNAMEVAHKLKQNNLPVTEENVTDIMSALELEEQTGGLTDDAREYCIRGDLELTIENLYMAMHSGNYQGMAGYYTDGSGYYAKAAATESLDDLLPQIEKFLTQSGIRPDEKSMGQAQWLVQRQLPLTKENLLKLQQLDDAAEVRTDAGKILEHMIDALLEGKRPAQAVLGEADSVLARSEQAVEIVQNATEEQLQSVVSSGREVTIAALAEAGAVSEDAAGDATAGTATGEGATMTEQELQLVTARRQLEEIRLQMTVESASVMIRNGISVETEGLAQLIEQLKRIEDRYYAQLLAGNRIEPTQEGISLYKEITAAVSGIANAPAALIGTMAFTETSLTIEAVSAEATVLTDRYRQAGEAYEAVMTRPRKDMGDSIQKAFRNVDDILEDLNLELTQENRRAVRILGYNSLAVTEENINRVKGADMEVTSMLENMKPNLVMEMIREGYNPLDKTAAQINEKLAQYRENTQAEQENFSEFLWNLEHTEGISDEERNAYIGIYRMLHQIEKSDGAVVGAVLEQGAALTMRNLMTGIRSGRHKTMDYKIGEMDGVEGTKTGSITEQIEEGYLGLLAGRLQTKMRDTDWTNAGHPETWMDMSLEGFADYVEELQEDGQASGYAQEQLKLLQQACESEEQLISRLTDGNQAVTVRNILAAKQLYGNRGSLYKELKELDGIVHEEDSRTLTDAMSQVEDAFTEESGAKEAYVKMLDVAQNTLSQAVETEDVTYEQMRNWKLLSSQLRLAGSLSGQEEYHIPVEIAGELTSVHVRFIHNTHVQGKAAVSFEIEKYGRVAAEFLQKEGRLEGYILSASEETKKLFESMDESFCMQLEEAAGVPVKEVSYAQHEQLDLLKFSKDAGVSDSDEGISSAALYRVARTFMELVKTVF